MAQGASGSAASRAIQASRVPGELEGIDVAAISIAICINPGEVSGKLD